MTVSLREGIQAASCPQRFWRTEAESGLLLLQFRRAQPGHADKASLHPL